MTTRRRNRHAGEIDFNPFLFNSLFQNLREKPSHELGLVIGSVMVATLLAVNALQGTLGTLQDFKLVEDVQVIAGLKERSWAAPQFPLARDVASWILLATIVSGAALLHKQWKLMSECLSRLAGHGAIVPRELVTLSGSEKIDSTETYGLNAASKLLGINRLIGDSQPDAALHTIVARVTNHLTKWRRLLLISTAGAAFVLGGLLGLGERHSLFIVFTPEFDGSRNPGLESELWLDVAYSGWWAGADHPAGYLLYGLFAVFGFFIVVSFAIVGFVALYLAIALRYVCQWRADWKNVDGRHGWQALAKVYRTVLLAVALLGIALTVTLTVLGVQNFVWLGVVLVLYVVVAPIFVLVPRILFRDVARAAKEHRIEVLKPLIQDDDLEDADRLANAQTVRTEIEYCRSAKIRPLRLRGASASTLFVFIILPVLLAVLQTFFPWLTGLQ